MGDDSLEAKSSREGTVLLSEKLTLEFPGVRPGTRYSLPFFLHATRGVPVFTDAHGGSLVYCVDPYYEAADHCLLWINYPGQDHHADGVPDVCVKICVYFGSRFRAIAVWQACKGTALEGSPAHPKPLEKVFLVADCFDSSGPVHWKHEYGAEKAVRIIPASDLPRRSQGCMPMAPQVGPRRAVQLNASLAGEDGGVSIRRPPPAENSNWPSSSRLYLRARFKDTMAMGVPQCHWLGFTSRLGRGAVGLAPHIPSHYSVVHGQWHAPGSTVMRKYERWQRSTVKRTGGWHLFELTWEQGQLKIAIDGESVSSAPAEDVVNNDAGDSIWLASESGSCGNWSDVELLHTPVGRGTWEAGVASIDPSGTWPWRIVSLEQGSWQVGACGEIEQEEQKVHVTESLELNKRGEEGGNEEQEEDEEIDAFPVEDDDDDVEEESIAEEQEEDVDDPAPSTLGVVEEESSSKPEPKSSKRQPKSQHSARAQPALQIECWAVPSETDFARLDRVVSTFLAQLQLAGVVLPDNFGRLATCSDSQHQNCYVFSFGTRRLHINAREGAGGRLTLVVRCGGGFLDFIEFAQRHGSLEQLRFQRLLESDGSTHRVKLTSVFSNGMHVLKAF